MDLLLWRHADAEDPPPGGADAERRLTQKGLKQAARVAAWLDARLPAAARVIVSPAARAQQTAAALSRSSATSDRLSPGAKPAEVLEAAGWPAAGDETVIIVGHQPTLGAAAALALTGKAAAWRLKKGAVWWLRSEDGGPALVVAVITPDLV
ncbi:MAG: phosphohistidine phosphatase, SixA [Betaproteobacteria bacterium]|jgi:phosphohistidine phosphatase|nr:phosphohistidine phosphatase, SixA [Betaproteobacteria bacterium]